MDDLRAFRDPQPVHPTSLSLTPGASACTSGFSSGSSSAPNSLHSYPSTLPHPHGKQKPQESCQRHPGCCMDALLTNCTPGAPSSLLPTATPQAADTWVTSTKPGAPGQQERLPLPLLPTAQSGACPEAAFRIAGLPTPSTETDFLLWLFPHPGVGWAFRRQPPLISSSPRLQPQGLDPGDLSSVLPQSSLLTLVHPAWFSGCRSLVLGLILVPHAAPSTIHM